MTKQEAMQIALDETTAYANLMEVFTYYHQTQDSELRDALFLRNENLVKKALVKYRMQSNYEDLLQEGNIALLQAIDRFDPAKGYQFSTFAYSYLKGAIARYLAGDRPLSMPVADQWVLISLPNYKKKFYDKTRRDPTTEECMEHFHTSKERFYDIQNYNQFSMISTSYLISNSENETGELTMEDVLCSTMESAYDQTYQSQIEEILLDEIYHAALGDYPWYKHSHKIEESQAQKNTEIVCKYFQLKGYSYSSYAAIAQEYGVSRERIRQIVGLILRRLRHPLTLARLKERLGIERDVPNQEVSAGVFQKEEQYSYGERI